MIKKILCISLPVLLLLLIAMATPILWYRFDYGENRGWQFGYYGEFNTVSNFLASSPGITVISSWYNPDITLEEFGFTVETEGKKTPLYFGEKDPVRRMSSAKMQTALIKRIAEALSNNHKEGIAD